VKRLFDIFFAVVGLVVLAPLGLLLALAVKLADGGAMFYGQVRVGQFGKRFWIWKFRSMVVNADKLGPPLTQEEDRRITAIGRFLRRTKLDELPQLWNVLVGEISFVGPRPEVPRYVDQYTPEQREVLRLKPGITDMASMLFRNEQELLKGASDLEGFYLRHCLPKKIELNRQYAERASLRQDVWIILQTLCPYWVAVLCVYSLCLAVSFWATYQLRFDFRVTSQGAAQFWRGLPWVVGLQLAALVWLGQLRGLMSYFSLPEMKRTLWALAWAALGEAGLLRLVQNQSAPVLSIVLLDAILSAAMLAGVRLGLRSLRERFAAAAAEERSGVARVLSALGIPNVVLPTSGDWLRQLALFLGARR